MAFSLRVPQKELQKDDTEKFTCIIDGTEHVNRHTEYKIRVCQGNSKTPWYIRRRYRDFVALHSILQISNIQLHMPPKKIIGNMQQTFIAERLQALQKYLNEILKFPLLYLSVQFRQFLDPEHYSMYNNQDIRTTIMYEISTVLRGQTDFEIKNNMKDVGWRIRKQRYWVTRNPDLNPNYILSWQYYGPDRVSCDREMQLVCKYLRKLSHPYIEQFLFIHPMELGLFTVTRTISGTIRDHLYATACSDSFLSKCGNPKVRKPFTPAQIGHYGNQIIQALIFLRDSGIPHGNLHAGNVGIDNQRALLLDLENSIAGSRSIYRQNILECKHLDTFESIDIYCFGKTIYEMALAENLFETVCDNYPGLSFDLESLLRQCIPVSATKHRWPRLDDLCKHPFFNLARPLHDRPLHIIPSPAQSPEVQKALATHCTKFLETLAQEQKNVRHARREERIQKIISSESELKQQRRKSRLGSGEWRSTSSLALSSCSSPTPPQIPEEISESSTSEPPPRVPSINQSSGSSQDRSALLSDICSFNKVKLNKVKSS